MTDAHLDHEVSGAAAPDTQLREALDRAAKLQRRLDAVQALLAEERAAAEAVAAGRTDHAEAEAIRQDLAAAQAQLKAVQKELRAVRASSTWKAGLAVKRAARPAFAARRRALRAVKALRGRAGGVRT